MQRHNWRRAAACIYRYTVRVREESRTPNIQEELHGILAAINALQLVDPTYAWFELPSRAGENPAPSKRQRLTAAQPQWLFRYFGGFRAISFTLR
jgi:nuclear pore complex protein Nup160